MVDWWSFGILLYEIVVGCPPFNHQSIAVVIKQIILNEFKPRPGFSKHFSNLL